jgi:hypothetical protein
MILKMKMFSEWNAKFSQVIDMILETIREDTSGRLQCYRLPGGAEYSVDRPGGGNWLNGLRLLGRFMKE